MDQRESLLRAKESFTECQDVLTALGDESRQNIILALFDTDCQTGLRVGEITEKVNLSRPAVSHHLKILRDAGLVQVRQEGTMNFYSGDLETNSDKMANLIKIMSSLKVGVAHA
jgi:ArsR family transcriptional regulator